MSKSDQDIQKAEQVAEKIKRLSAQELHALCENLIEDFIGYRIYNHLDILITAKEYRRQELQNSDWSSIIFFMCNMDHHLMYGKPISLSTDQYRKWEDYVLKNYADFYRNKVCYETLRVGNLYIIRPVSCLFEHYDALVLISKTKEVENG